MTENIKRALIKLSVLAIVLAIPFLPGVPWSVHCCHFVKKVVTKAEQQVTSWQTAPQDLYLAGKIMNQKGGLKGAEIEILDSASGWNALTDNEGRFLLSKLKWYPHACFTLVITANHYQSRQLKVSAPADYPTEGRFDIGEIDYERCDNIAGMALPGRNSISFLKYDWQNQRFYQSLFESLTNGKSSDEAKVGAICHYVAGKLISENSDKASSSIRYFNEVSPRQSLERGSRYCGELALAIASIAEAGHYQTHIIDLTDAAKLTTSHVVIEIFYGDHWHLYDPTTGEAVKQRDGRILSYKELSAPFFK